MHRGPYSSKETTQRTKIQNIIRQLTGFIGEHLLVLL